MKTRTRPKSMADIAALAKVSKPTVSRALRDSPLVTPETKALILAVAAKHGYAVNRNAQKLRDKRTNTIAVVADFKSFPGSRIHDPFSFELLADVGQALALRNQDLLLCAPAVDENHSYESIVVSRHADGIIFLGQGRRDAALRKLADTDAPFVVWGAVAKDQPYCAVGGDNLRGGELAGERFALMRRRKPLYIGGSDEHLEMKLRRQGFEKALRNASTSLILADFSYEAALAALDAHLDSKTKVPDAIFAASDTIAMGVYAALKKRGLKIPDDVSVIGYNDNPHAAWCTPSLTTVRQDTRQAGALLVEQLMRLLEGGSAKSIMMPAELVVRES
ncbi:MAG TPA: substrate-binding domain-containing protein [Nevskiaceae bacterium]|nr:substrate-binding domain-containing protein [Nevskiaceae bacterium]